MSTNTHFHSTADGYRYPQTDGAHTVLRNGSPWADAIVVGLSGGLIVFPLMTGFSSLWTFIGIILMLGWRAYRKQISLSIYDEKQTDPTKTVMSNVILIALLIPVLWMSLSDPSMSLAISLSALTAIVMALTVRSLTPYRYFEDLKEVSHDSI